LLRVAALGPTESDPIPDDSILHDTQCAIFQTDANRIDVILPFQLLKLQAGVRRIALEDTICALGIPLSADR
jgi:hypothetical protein